MNCLTPSNPDPIPFGISYDINDSLASTSNGSLFKDARSMDFESQLPPIPYPMNLTDIEIKGEQHRVDTTPFLIAQTKSKVSEVRKVWSDLQNAKKDGSSVKDRFKTRGKDIREEIGNSSRIQSSEEAPWEEIFATRQAPSPQSISSPVSKVKHTRVPAKDKSLAPLSVTPPIKTKSGRTLVFKTRPGVARVVQLSKKDALLKEWAEEDSSYDGSEGLEDEDDNLDETAASTFKISV